MRVAVTGATGNIGTSLVRALADDERTEHVLGIARRLPGRRTPRTDYAAADLVSDDLEYLFEDRDAVVHLGWLLQPARDPIATWRANVIGSKRVFEAAARAGVKALIYSSSIGAYAPRVDHRPVGEEWPTDGSPLTAYTREKAYVERLLDLFELRHREIRTVRMRPAFVFKRSSAAQQRRLFAGPFLPGRMVSPRLVPAMPVVDGVRFQAVHADDVAEAFRAALFGTVSGPFNLAGESLVDMRSVAALLHARAIPMPYAAARKAMAAAWRMRLSPTPPELLDVAAGLPVMDTTRAVTELGWHPERSGEEALGEFLKGLRTGAGYPTPPLRRKVEGGRLGELATGVGRRE